MWWREADEKWVLTSRERLGVDPKCPACMQPLDIVLADYAGIPGVVCLACADCEFLDSVSSVANIPRHWFDANANELRTLSAALSDAIWLQDRKDHPAVQKLIASIERAIEGVEKSMTSDVSPTDAEEAEVAAAVSDADAVIDEVSTVYIPDAQRRTMADEVSAAIKDLRRQRV